MAEIRTKDIEELLTFFGKNTYRARESSATVGWSITCGVCSWQWWAVPLYFLAEKAVNEFSR